MQTRKTVIPFKLWLGLRDQLYRRSDGKRESGAFLLGKRLPTYDKVYMYVCFDDVDPAALKGGYIRISSTGFAKLWAVCRENKLTVLADIHTHPGINVQSPTDIKNPMINEPGHLAIIVSHYARKRDWFMSTIRIYEYAGNYSWHSWEKISERIRLCLW
jgi:proteasome lid subunit RPN8/RPN11